MGLNRKIGGFRITPHPQALEKGIAGDIFQKHPIRNPSELKKIRDELVKSAPLYIRIFHALAVETGHRPGDLCEITWRNVDFSAGALVDVRVNKQSQAATTKAITKHFRAAYEAKIIRARRSRDFDTLDHLVEIGFGDGRMKFPTMNFINCIKKPSTLPPQSPPKCRLTVSPQTCLVY